MNALRAKRASACSAIRRGSYRVMVAQRDVREFCDVSSLKLRMHPNNDAVATWTLLGAMAMRQRPPEPRSIPDPPTLERERFQETRAVRSAEFLR